MPEVGGRVTLWGIEVFLAVADEGSVTAAARRLGVSAPAISQQIAAVEATLSVALFDRSARPFALTQAGALFRRHAQGIVNAEAEARADLARAGAAPITTLRFGMIEDFDADVTPALLSGLAAAMPGCRFLLETGPSHRLMDGLETRALDLVVAADMAVDRAGAGWRDVHPLMVDPFVAIRPRGAPDVPLILYSGRHLMGRQIAAWLEAQPLRHPVRFELDSYPSILAMVAQGQGWTILTPLALLHAERFLDAVEVTPLKGAAMERRLSLSARKGMLQEVPSAVIAALRAHLSALVIAPALGRWAWLAPHLRLL